MADRYGWDAQTVSRMTPAQIWMYCDGAEQQPREGERIDPVTGHKIVRVESMEEAQALLKRVEEKRHAES